MLNPLRQANSTNKSKKVLRLIWNSSGKFDLN